ncbi:MAG: ribose-phosphate diphosphokinase [Rhodoblastus sp.]|uniref:ribose-phosphate diphosphokinase n=1 Tax=Rhodoblastus sp. TaxID=1962975 RepID=UPI003F978C07
MTTLAFADLPLRRLFARLDFAPRPREENLLDLLGRWDTLREGHVAPKLPLSEGAVPPDAFVFLRGGLEHDYILQHPYAGLAALLGIAQADDKLSKAPILRQAARLRRLFDTVIQTGEPVLAEFSIEGHGESASVVDFLAAPLADEEGRIAGVLGGYALRPELGGEAHRPSHAAPASGPVVFALSNSRALAENVAACLGSAVAAHELRKFEDGEFKIRPLVGVRGRDVYVFADLAACAGESVNDKLCKLLFFVGALKQSAAQRVTVVAPYLCYARKERQTKPRDPVATRYLAQMFEAVGVDCVITMTAHDLAAFQNAYRCGAEHLDAGALFAHALAERLEGREVAVVSPDPGGEKRAELFRETLERRLKAPVAKGLVDKKRSMGKVTGDLFAGDVEGRVAVVYDDMIVGGGTMTRAAKACRRNGASEVIAVATHGLFTGGAEQFFRDPSIDEIWITDSIMPGASVEAEVRNGRVRLVPVGKLLADVIRACHSGGSIDDLLEHDLSPMVEAGG